MIDNPRSCAVLCPYGTCNCMCIASSDRSIFSLLLLLLAISSVIRGDLDATDNSFDFTGSAAAVARRCNHAQRRSIRSDRAEIKSSAARVMDFQRVHTPTSDMRRSPAGGMVLLMVVQKR